MDTHPEAEFAPHWSDLLKARATVEWKGQSTEQGLEKWQGPSMVSSDGWTVLSAMEGPSKVSSATN
jgi:hypothetical protein